MVILLFCVVRVRYNYLFVFCWILQTIYYSSPTSAGAECIDPNCTWVEQWWNFSPQLAYLIVAFSFSRIFVCRWILSGSIVFVLCNVLLIVKEHTSYSASKFCLNKNATWVEPVGRKLVMKMSWNFAGFIVLGHEKRYILNQKKWKQQL